MSIRRQNLSILSKKLNIVVEFTMQSKKCTHIRIRDGNDYHSSVEDIIKLLEAKHKIDIRSIPRWEELVQRLHVATTDCKRKLQGARLRKSMIIEKLYIQSTRLSPFELTSGLCRTASKWRKMEAELKKLKSVVSLEPILEPDHEMSMGLEEQSEAMHPNTCISSTTLQHTSIIPEPLKVDVELQVEIPVVTCLPVTIITNPHKFVSPLGSQFSGLSFKSVFSGTEGPLEDDREEWQCLEPTSSVVSIPPTIILTNNTLKQQFVQFTVINCASEYMHIRFRSMMNNSHFKITKILPGIPKRLYPGIPIVFKFIFQLNGQEEFKSGLFFKVGVDVCDDIPPEAFCIPIFSAFTAAHSVTVSESITIPPVYPWHIKRNGVYSTATVNISVNDPFTYHLHIYKRLVNLSQESDISLSLQGAGVNTESDEEREIDNDDAVNTIVSSPVIDTSLETINIIESMDFMVRSTVELALDPFVFKSTYLYLKPYESVKIPVYLTKNEHIGYHHSYYTLEFIDIDTEQVIMTKTVKVFAEVLPHPIKIHPEILDMSNSPVTHGYIKDHFIVTNTHKIYLAHIKIKLTTKMKKMFNVEPMEATVPASSCVHFTVRFCSRDLLTNGSFDDLAHFTFKIIVSGYKTVFENVPPLFYEIIAPCAMEFKRVYNEKYFREESTSC